jgi:hypothetical protein
MFKTFALPITAFGLALSPLVAAPVAQAGIVCKDGFQMSGGDWISTPYCSDADLAHIARQHGVRVSADEVRRNPAKKYELCRFLGTESAGSYCPDDGGDHGH